MLSAWDKVEDEGHDPETFLTQELPLLDQYLRQGTDGWDFRIYGLSAQGGDYEPQLAEGKGNRSGSQGEGRRDPEDSPGNGARGCERHDQEDDARREAPARTAGAGQAAARKAHDLFTQACAQHLRAPGGRRSDDRNLRRP